VATGGPPRRGASKYQKPAQRKVGHQGAAIAADEPPKCFLALVSNHGKANGSQQSTLTLSLPLPPDVVRLLSADIRSISNASGSSAVSSSIPTGSTGKKPAILSDAELVKATQQQRRRRPQATSPASAALALCASPRLKARRQQRPAGDAADEARNAAMAQMLGLAGLKPQPKSAPPLVDAAVVLAAEARAARATVCV